LAKLIVNFPNKFGVVVVKTYFALFITVFVMYKIFKAIIK